MRTKSQRELQVKTLPAPIALHTSGAKPMYLPPQQAVTGFSIGRDEVLAALTRGGYLAGGKTTEKMSRSQIVAFCDRQQLWNMKELLRVLQVNSPVHVKRIPVNQTIPANVKPGVFVLPHMIAPYFHLSPGAFRALMADGGWWFHIDREQPRGSRERKLGKPRQWVIDRGFAKKVPVKLPDGSTAQVWAVDAWHVMKTFAGQVGSPVPCELVRVLDFRVEPPKPNVNDYVEMCVRKMRAAYSRNDVQAMLHVARSARLRGREYARALESACGLPAGAFSGSGWVDRVPAGVLG